MTWSARFFEVMGDVVTDEVLDKVRQNAPDGCFSSEDLNWIDSFITCDGTDVRAILMDRFGQSWPSVRAYHACRPSNLDSYRDNGLRPQTAADYKNSAIAIFYGELRVSKTDVLAEIDQIDWSNYEEKVFFCLSYEWLRRKFSGCWERGSEALYGLAVKLKERCGRSDICSHIEQRGHPQILECDVPASLIDSAYLRCLCGRIIAGSVQHRLDSSWAPEFSHLGIAIRRPMAPDCIVGWHDPTQ